MNKELPLINSIPYATLAGNFAANCGLIMSERAPSKIGFGYVTQQGDIQTTRVVDVVFVPAGKHYAPTEHKAVPLEERAPLDVWDQVWLHDRESGEWLCCGNRCGGVQEFTKLVAPHLAAVAVQESKAAALA